MGFGHVCLRGGRPQRGTTTRSKAQNERVQGSIRGGRLMWPGRKLYWNEVQSQDTNVVEFLYGH